MYVEALKINLFCSLTPEPKLKTHVCRKQLVLEEIIFTFRKSSKTAGALSHENRPFYKKKKK